MKTNAARLLDKLGIAYQHLLCCGSLPVVFAKIFGQEKDYLKCFTIRDRWRWVCNQKLVYTPGLAHLKPY
ncbi:hypothetical protein PQG02_35735 (plasmid) [Nostoc sp. UHCC 0926]|uniref:hypothetical protein n=1 Tax=Nostoc sp. UHCC 0926 TaxID=3025190 RepID=UPI00235F633D|nr:hypothetical protein [Nostoc sp. UHCC 0926]WDD36501.1 hypothetical protein PQG02_35735 [Nostoc sp. UHCC 0926]